VAAFNDLPYSDVFLISGLVCSFSLGI